MSYDLKDYVTVAQRMRTFLERYPDGSMQLDPVEFREIEGKTWVIGRAYAYRTPEDPRPGIGTAWEVIPGMTPFTKFSEVQNVETSAWGRALAALGIGIDKGVATWEEVNRTSRQERPQVATDSPQAPASEPASRPHGGKQPGATATERQVNWARRLVETVEEGPELAAKYLGSTPIEMAPRGDVSRLIDDLKTRKEEAMSKVTRTQAADPDDPWHMQEPPEDTG